MALVPDCFCSEFCSDFILTSPSLLALAAPESPVEFLSPDLELTAAKEWPPPSDQCKTPFGNDASVYPQRLAFGH